MTDVAIVGGGIAGLACARALVAAGIDAVVYDRGQRVGGRLAAQTLRDGPHSPRIVDVGASYFTADDPGFLAVVDDWISRGLLRPWTDTFHVADGDHVVGTKTGPVRYAAPAGLRSLAEDLARGLDVRHPVDVTEVVPTDDGVLVRTQDSETPYDVVALCGPDPQMRRLMPGEDPADQPPWEPVLALTAVYAERTWEGIDGVFVNDSLLTFIADDGRRRGDDAPVLVAHSGPVLAAQHLADPLAAAPAMLADLRRIMGTPDPESFTVKRWTYARPTRARDATHAFDGRIGWAGDAWAGGPRTQSAWVSGDALGRAIAQDPSAQDPPAQDDA